MQNLRLIIILLIGNITGLKAQSFISIPNNDFGETETVPCAYNSSTSIVKYQHWDLYQTTNDEWNGPKDSSRCISLEVNGNRAVVPTKSIDRSKKLFAHNSGRFPMNANTVFPFNFSLRTGTNALDTNCKSGSCQNLMVRTEHKYVSEDTSVILEHKVPVKEPWGNPFGGSDLCLISQKADSNFITDVIFELKVKPNDSTASLEYRGFYQPNDHVTFVFDSVITCTDVVNDSVHQFTSQPLNANLVRHRSSGVPSATNISYTQMKPVGSVSRKVMCQLKVGEYSGVFFQDHTELIGVPYKTSSDSGRHSVDLLIDGGNICLSPTVELVVKPGNSLTYRGGKLSLESARSCIMLEKDAKLAVGESAHLPYGGDTETGILLLKGGSQIHLEKNAKLSFHNKIMLRANDATDTSNVHVFLKPGNELSFNKGASLLDKFSPNKTTQLVVHLQGGMLNTSGLSDDEKALIKVIESPSFHGNISRLKPYPNPTKSGFYISFKHHETDELTWTILSTAGKEVLHGQEMVKKGSNSIPFNTQNLENGVYFLRLKTRDAVQSGTFIKK